MKKPATLFKTIFLTGLLALCLYSCYNYDKDCYSIGRELTEEEKNIFPYQVGDSIVFTDGEKDYYMVCKRIVDTIYTKTIWEDYYCKGDVQQFDEYLRMIIFKTDINFSDNSGEIFIWISASDVAFRFKVSNSYNPYLFNIGSEDFYINTNTLLNTTMTNSGERVIYIDSVNYGSKYYYNVYKLSVVYERSEYNIDSIYVNKQNGLLSFVFKDKSKIVIK